MTPADGVVRLAQIKAARRHERTTFETKEVRDRFSRCVVQALEQSHPSWNRDGGFRNGPEM